MRAYGHAIVIVMFALVLTAGVGLRTALVPFLLLEAGAIWLHVGYEREQWHDARR